MLEGNRIQCALSSSVNTPRTAVGYKESDGCKNGWLIIQRTPIDIQTAFEVSVVEIRYHGAAVIRGVRGRGAQTLDSS